MKDHKAKNVNQLTLPCYLLQIKYMIVLDQSVKSYSNDFNSKSIKRFAQRNKEILKVGAIDRPSQSMNKNPTIYIASAKARDLRSHNSSTALYLFIKSIEYNVLGPHRKSIFISDTWQPFPNKLCSCRIIHISHNF